MNVYNVSAPVSDSSTSTDIGNNVTVGGWKDVQSTTHTAVHCTQLLLINIQLCQSRAILIAGLFLQVKCTYDIENKKVTTQLKRVDTSQSDITLDRPVNVVLSLFLCWSLFKRFKIFEMSKLMAPIYGNCHAKPQPSMYTVFCTEHFNSEQVYSYTYVHVLYLMTHCSFPFQVENDSVL